MAFDLQAVLPTLLPKAISWAETQSLSGIEDGISLSASGLAIAKKVGVARPELIRIVIGDQLPAPTDQYLHEAALETGLLGPNMIGLTLGHCIFVVHGYLDLRLLAHECRHVHQYETYGSIAAFLPVYLHQIATFGYQDAPLEKDARMYELNG